MPVKVKLPPSIFNPPKPVITPEYVDWAFFRVKYWSPKLTLPDPCKSLMIAPAELMLSEISNTPEAEVIFTWLEFEICPSSTNNKVPFAIVVAPV